MGPRPDPAPEPVPAPEPEAPLPYSGHGFELWLDDQKAELPEGETCWVVGPISGDPRLRFELDPSLGSFRRCELNVQPLRGGRPDFTAHGRADTHAFRPQVEQRLTQAGLQWVQYGAVSQLSALPPGPYNAFFTVYCYRDGAPTWDRKQLHLVVR